MRIRTTTFAAWLLLPLGAVAQIAPLGVEFQVNTYTTTAQFVPRVAAGADGAFVMAWESFGQDGDGSGVFGQRHDSAGQAVGTEFRVNGYTVGYQRFPSVAAGADGAFVVAWHSYQDGDVTGVFGQRYDRTGQPVGTEFQVSTHTEGNQRFSAVAMSADDAFVVAWMSDQDGDGYGVFAQRYDSGGTPLGGEFQINSYTLSNQRMPAVAAGAAGAFVVAWQSYQDGDVSGVFGQRYDSAGQAVGTEFQVNSYTTGYQFGAAVAVDMHDAFVVAWQSYQDGDLSGVFGQRYDRTGQVVGSEFQVNSYTADYQRSPTVVTGADGNFAVAWQSLDQDGGGYGVFGQLYDDAGRMLGSEFQVNSFTAGYQRSPAMAAGVDGTFVVAWQSFDQDGSGDGVFGQRFAFPSPTPCAGDCPTPSPTAISTSTKTSTPVPTPTSSPTQTSTLPASATPTATETPTAASSHTPTGTSTPSTTASRTFETTPTATPTDVAACAGDCDGDGTRSLDELITGVAIALDRLPVGDCPAFDADENGRITIDELVAAVDAALNGCSG